MSALQPSSCKQRPSEYLEVVYDYQLASEVLAARGKVLGGAASPQPPPPSVWPEPSVREDLCRLLPHRVICDLLARRFERERERIETKKKEKKKIL